MQIDLRRFDGFMTEPQRDHGAIDARLQKLHRSGVPQTCGDTRLDFNDGYLSLATRTYLASSDWTLSALRLPPCTLGNKALAPRRTGSLSHA
jgi:hypothetical protein